MLSEGFDVPIAFFVFNRPDKAAEVFSCIRMIRPRKLLLICDGPRATTEDDEINVAAVRDLLGNIDWDCEVHRNFSDVNLGCKVRISSGLSWVFSLVDRAIILEDDCLPSLGFFGFCREMLLKYENNHAVFSVSGTCFSENNLDVGHGFSRYSLMWGWATWADRWDKYILNPDDCRSVIVRTWIGRPLVLAYWLFLFRDLEAKRTWDYQWILTLWRHRALACRPSRNLVKNIGFGIGATHTTNPNTPLAKMIINDTDISFEKALGPVVPDRRVEAADEQHWAQIRLHRVLGMAFPQLVWLKRTFLRLLMRKSSGESSAA